MIRAGESFTINLVIHGFPSIEGGGVSLRYDSSVIHVTGVSINDSIWDFVNRTGEIDNNDGQVTDILFSSYNGVGDEAVIATLEFEAVGYGRTTLQLQESSVNPFASQGSRMAVEFAAASVIMRGGRK